MSQLSLRNLIKNKFSAKEYNFVAKNIIYDYYLDKQDAVYDLNNVSVIGLGQIIGSNVNQLQSSINVTIDNPDNHNHFLLLKNEKNNEYSAILLPAAIGIIPEEESLLPAGYPIYYKVKGNRDNNSVVYENIVDEQLEVVPLYFDKKVPFINLMTDDLYALNNYICKLIGPDEKLPFLSEIEKQMKGSYIGK